MSIAPATEFSFNDPRISPYVANPFLLCWNDPFKMIRECWPKLRMYDKQAEIIQSVWDNDDTIVPAGNDLGKDWIAGLIALLFFCTRSPCRVVTTSVDGSQLEGVLWGEIRNFINTSDIPLPIIVNHLHIRQKVEDGQREAKSELIGRVVQVGEGLLGRHLPWFNFGGKLVPACLCIYDESSALGNTCFDTSDTWTHRRLIFGNCYPCENRFKEYAEAGDVPREEGETGYVRKVILIRAEDSPNVRLAFQQEEMGKKPTGEILIPGLLSHQEYKRRRRLWDPMRQCVGLDAKWYKGKEVMLYPEEWLSYARLVYRWLQSNKSRRKAKTMGVDSAEGGDSSDWTVIDEYGILHRLSIKTWDTTAITARTIALIKEWDLPPENVLFDRGGGGKEHADRLRSQGYDVRTVAFGEPATDPHKIEDKFTVSDRREDVETRYIYKNRRAEMYGLLRLLLDPGPMLLGQDGRPIARVDVKITESGNPVGFGIPPDPPEEERGLTYQLSKMPLLYDEEGRMWLPPKNKKNREDKKPSLREILGCSPDGADSLVLAVFGLVNVPGEAEGGAVDI